MLAHARQARPAVIGIEHEERIQGDEDEGKRLIERERAHVALDPADLDIRSARAPLGALEHRTGAVQSDNVMAVLGDRNRDPARPAAELQDRAAGPAREAAEPLDVRSSFEWRAVEVVERREARGLGRIPFGALPVTRAGRRAPPSRV